MTQILICTVGGSHQPIVKAINELRPDYVVFICTDRDPATNQPGSRIQIEGQGNCIKARPSDDRPTLPNIPTQTGIAPEQYETVTTLADDLDRIYLDCDAVIVRINAQFPNAKITADFTGGTKSMSAGLVTAALERPDINLQLVTGGRVNLVGVQDGAEYAAQANSEQIRFQRQIAPYKQAWTRYAYSEAEAGLRSLKPPADTRLRGQYSRFRELSRALAEWDNFNHAQALVILQQYAPGLSEALRPYIGIAMRLNDQNLAKRDAARLLDLYRNAERRAAQGRYDDAVARAYRLLEWSAQWILETQCGIKTGDIHPAQLPENMVARPNRNGQIQFGLFDAWQLVKLKTHGAGARFIQDQENTLLNHTRLRNGSILAHGFDPLGQKQWQTIHDWLESQFIPMLLEETTGVGVKILPPQLPALYEA